MLHGNGTSRLTRREIARWTRITGFVPENVRTVADLQDYARRCKRYYWGTSNDTRFLHRLIDTELQFNLGSLPGGTGKL
jgi:hypothetical protein